MRNWTGKGGVWRDWEKKWLKILTFLPHAPSIYKCPRAKRRCDDIKATLSLTLDGFSVRSRAEIVLEKPRRRFSVAACHREGGVCVYSNITERGCQPLTDPLRFWRTEGAAVWPQTLLQRACLLMRPEEFFFCLFVLLQSHVVPFFLKFLIIDR